MKYWIPLLKKGKWTGKALPLPINTTIIKKIKIKNKELTINIKKEEYTLAYNKIRVTENWLEKENQNKEMNQRPNLPKEKGIKIVLSGRLKGVSKGTKMIITKGVIRAQSIQNQLDYYSRPIYTKWGTIGIKVYISPTPQF